MLRKRRRPLDSSLEQDSFFVFCPQTVRNPFNSQSLISHLTNSNGCGNMWFKVLLTVSPFRPSFLPQLRVSPSVHRFLSPLFSYRYKSLSAQPSCFHIHTKPPGCYPPASLIETSPPLCLSVSVANLILSTTCRLLFSLGSLFRTPVLCFQQLAVSFPKSRGVGIPRIWNICSVASVLRPQCPLCCAFPASPQFGLYLAHPLVYPDPRGATGFLATPHSPLATAPTRRAQSSRISRSQIGRLT